MENTVRKEIACYEQLLHSRCFKKNTCTADMYKQGLFGESVKHNWTKWERDILIKEINLWPILNNIFEQFQLSTDIFIPKQISLRHMWKFTCWIWTREINHGVSNVKSYSGDLPSKSYQGTGVFMASFCKTLMNPGLVLVKPTTYNCKLKI